MKNSLPLNSEIVPVKFSPRGESSETRFQQDLGIFFSQYGFQCVEMPIITNDFFSFDFLGLPEYSPVRSDNNVIHFENGSSETSEVPTEILDIIRNLHQRRFGVLPRENSTERNLLVSHTTAQLIEFLFNHEPKEIYTISKTFRERKEKRESTQAEVVLIDRSIQEIITFIERLFSIMTHKQFHIQLVSDFYYFLEPSFSFSSVVDGQFMELGSAGFMRKETMEALKVRQPKMKAKTIAFVGIPYLKLLNLRLGERFDNFNIDYNNR